MKRACNAKQNPAYGSEIDSAELRVNGIVRTELSEDWIVIVELQLSRLKTEVSEVANDAGEVLKSQSFGSFMLFRWCKAGFKESNDVLYLRFGYIKQLV